MKPEQQRIAIAKACGWTHVWRGEHTGILTGYDPNDGKERTPPDYLNNLNAMHVAEKVLVTYNAPPSAYKTYDTKLWEKCREDQELLNGYTWHATAAQRAEAFLRTINKWEDAP
jgi:hypothetical protein